MLIIQLIIMQIITFLALVFVLRKIMYSASYVETKRLQQLSQENARRAQELAAKMEEAERQYKDKLSAVEMEVKKLKIEAKEEVEKLKEETLNKAKQESERIIKQALNTKEKVKEELQAQMQEKCIEQASALIQNVLNAGQLLLLHRELVNSISEEIGKIDPGLLKVSTDKGQLCSPHGISQAEKEKIISALSAKTGKSISLNIVEDKHLIAGITIKLGSLVIDGSLSEKLKNAAEVLRKS